MMTIDHLNMSKLDQRKRQRKNSSSDSDDGPSRSKKMYSDGYDDEYRGNADDRAWLNTLTEREREAELLKRHEQREILHHREEISKKLKSKQKTEDDETKTKSTEFDNDIYADDDEDDLRAPANRRKQVNASKQKETQHSKTLQALIEERKKKQDEKSRKSLPKPGDLSSSDDESPEKSSKTNEKEKLTVAQVYASSESESESDDDDDHTATTKTNRRRRSRSPDNGDKGADDQQEINRKKCTPITSKSQLKSMVLSRFRMEKWCHAPFFSKVAKGAFVRINIGQNNGMPVYRVCEIRDVVETAKIYTLGATRTNKGLRLKHGDNERVFRLEFVSNSEISDAEFKRWREASIKQGIQLPTLQDMERKIKAIDECKHYVLSNADISKIVEEKSRFRKAPINYAMAKNELLKEIEIAKDENDTVRETELRKKLTQTEERASELDRIRSQNISVIAQINQRNRKNTQENVESAITRENQHANTASDPFTRRRCAPMLGVKAAQTKDELIRQLHSQRAAEEEVAAAKKTAEEQRLIAQKTDSKVTTSTTVANSTTIDTLTLTQNGLSTMTTHERGSFTLLADNSDEIFTSHDFELDFTIKLLPE